MQPTKTSPTYNLGAIIRETGIKADTLRAWERRYNLPQPTRSKGRQRLYSQRDLETIKWLIARQEEGMRISQAAELWHRQVSEGLNPLEEGLQLKTEAAAPAPTGINLVDYRNKWLSACKTFNESEAEQVVAEAFSQYAPETVCFEVLLAGLAEIGEGWYQGDISVQQEHFASALVSRRLNALIMGAPAPIHTPKIVVAAAPEEDHTIPSLLLTFLLRRRGWDVVFLGADVPLANFRSTLDAIQPRLVILIAHQLITAASLLDLINDLDGLQTTLAFGGLIFNRIPSLREHLPGHFLGADLKNAVPNIEQLLQISPERQAISSQAESPLSKQFSTGLPAIEIQLNQAADTHSALQTVNSQYLSRDIQAALKLGDIALMENNLGWVRGLLSNVNVPSHLLQDFLQIYYQAVEEVLGSGGAPVLNGLEAELNRAAENK